MARRWFGGLLVLVAVGRAGAEAPRYVEEIWESAALDGARVGYLHTTVQALEGDGPKRLRTTADLNLTFRRQRAAVRLRVETGTEETADGKVVGVFMRQGQGDRTLTLTGALEDGRMHVRIDGGRIDRRLRWGDEVVGMYRLEHLFEKRRPKPGDRFSFPRYEPTLNAVVTVRAAVSGPEEVPTPAGRQKLLRVDLVPDKVEGSGLSVQLPPAVWWLDAGFVPVRRQIELEGLGAVVLTRTTRAAATAPAAGPARGADIGLKTLVPLNRAIARPHFTRAAVYRVTLRGDADPGTAFANDGHQEVRNLRGNTFELHVHPVQPAPAGGAAAEAPGAEFLAPSHFIDSDDARVKELARRAVGGETDPLRKARRIENWAHQTMRVDNTAPFAPAGQVARSLRGDCRQYALLTAALCRAEGLPSRTAVGLVYVEKDRRPFLGMHMWAEVWVGGRWLGLDAVWGRVGATHVKVADHSWHETQSLTPFLPVSRILGKVAVEVVRVEAGD
jgi:transglutaminase-like putative cysteine protease